MVGRHTQTQSYFSSVSLSLMSCLSLGCCSIGLHNFLHNENQRTSSSDRDLFFDGATMDFLHCTQEGSRVWLEKNPNYNKASVFWQNQFFIAKMKLLVCQLKTFPNHNFHSSEICSSPIQNFFQYYDLGLQNSFWLFAPKTRNHFGTTWVGLPKTFVDFYSNTDSSMDS